ncbi:MAG: hypothetical protein JWO50_443 [Candidatus Kaiserbacteria bacterium]|nr:hypothetical protein [Candidatus Kaiserbacteria bacterium]
MDENEIIESSLLYSRPKSVGAFVATIIVLVILCLGAMYVFVNKRAERQQAQQTSHIISGTTTIDLGTTTIQ